MTWLDWVVIAMIVYFMIQGLFKGVAAVAMGALAIVVAYIGAGLALPAVGDFLVNVKSPIIPPDLSPEWRRTVGFTVTFLTIYVVLVLLSSILPGGKRPGLPAQMLGIVGGAVKAVLASMAFIAILLASPLSEAFAKDVERSTIAKYVAALQKDFSRNLRSVSPTFPPIGPDRKF